MRRFGFSLAAVLLAGVLGAQAAHALPKFTQYKAFPTDGNLAPLRVGDPLPAPFHGGLYVEFTEVGLGGTAIVNYTVTATATAVYACVNKGSKKPSAANKVTVTAPTSAAGQFSSDLNGKIVGALAVPPLPANANSCPPGQAPVLQAVSYTNVVLTDVTNGVSVSIPGVFSLDHIILP